MDSAGIAALLSTIPCDPGTGPAVLRETHISWVILCGEFAYKIKKPVNFGFLDFSSLAQRRHFCDEELRLNRRFSPELYLAVVPVTAGARAPEIDGRGPVVDYAVKMRRFDEDQLLVNIAARHGLDHSLLRALAMELARVHEALPPCRVEPDRGEPGTPAALWQACEDNFTTLRGYDLPQAQLQQLEAIAQWSRERYDALLPLFTQRLSEGRVIDGHGDAHLGNIAVVDGAVRLFDCIEFNAAFRVMDSISEIAFLAMDMDARGYAHAAHRLLTEYLEYSGDYGGLALVDFYCCYFAMVRAKVDLLRAAQEGTDLTASEGYREFERYLALALQRTHHRRIFLGITHGLSGSGKSTVAGALVEYSGAVRVRSDVERKRLAGMVPEARCDGNEQQTLYSEHMTRRTFAHLEALAEAIAASGFPVIVDATFLHRDVRERFYLLAQRLGVPFVIVDCSVSEPLLRQRLLARERDNRDASDATVAVMEMQMRSAEPLTVQEEGCRVAADVDADYAMLWQRVQERCFGR